MANSEQHSGPVTVLTTSDPALLAVAKSLLEAEHIDFYARGEAVQDLYAFSRFTAPTELQVAAEDAERASELLSDLNG